MSQFLDRVLTENATGVDAANCTWTSAPAQFALPPTGIDTIVSYTLLDSNGIGWESGRAQLTESGGTYTLVRGGSQEVMFSSNDGDPISLTDESTHTIFIVPGAKDIEELIFPRIVVGSIDTGVLDTSIDPRIYHQVQLTENVTTWNASSAAADPTGNASLTMILFTPPDTGGPFTVDIPGTWYQLGQLESIELQAGDAPLVCMLTVVGTLVLHTISQSVAPL